MAKVFYQFIEPEFLTQESIKRKTELLMKGSLKDVPIDYTLLYCSIQKPDLVLATVDVINKNIGYVSLNKVDMGELIKPISDKLVDLEPELRRKEVYFYMSKVFIHGKDFIFDRLRLNDNIQDGKKTSGSINVKLKEVKASSEVKNGKVVLVAGEETGNEYVINKTSTYSDEFDDSMLIRSLNNKIVGCCTVKIPYSIFKDVLEGLSNEYKAFFYLQILPGLNVPELKPYQDKILKIKSQCKRSGHHSKFYNLKNKCLDRFIESIIYTQG